MFFQVLRDRVVQGILMTLALMIGVGCVYYRIVEDWSWLDSLYFCVVTLTTIGYGDFAPESAAGKLFTIFYVFSGVGLFAVAGTAILQRSPLWQRLEKRARQQDSERQP